MLITASILHDYFLCPHRIWRDLYGPQKEKDKGINPLVNLLWNKGVARENEVVASLGKFTDLGKGNFKRRLTKTLQAMKKGAPLIYQGVLHYGNLVGIPDLLKRNQDGTYTPIDIKSTRGYEGILEDEENPQKLKKYYTTQLGLYLELLKLLGFSQNNHGIIFNIEGKEIIYNLKQTINLKSNKIWWDFYYEAKKEVWQLINNQKQNRPALSNVCNLCPWQKSCRDWCFKTEDLTTIFYLGRRKRKVLNKDLEVKKVRDLTFLNVVEVLKRKRRKSSFLAGIGETTLKKFAKRANILVNLKKPVVYQPFNFPKVSYELFFDIEDDPTQELVYLHGIYERSLKGERFVYFLAKENSQEEEKRAWQQFWEYIRKLPQNNFALYYYASYEKIAYKKLWEKYPKLISLDELSTLFNRKYTLDLYSDIILKKTDWPLSSYSLKEIASYLGFTWRDQTPSGALSIEWYNKYLETKDPQVLQRIINYNEDDCKALMIIKEKLEELMMHEI